MPPPARMPVVEDEVLAALGLWPLSVLGLAWVLGRPPSEIVAALAGLAFDGKVRCDPPDLWGPTNRRDR